MEKRTHDYPIMSGKRLLDANDLCIYLSLGRNRAMEFGRRIGAEVKIGKRTLFDKMVIDQYFDSRAKEQIREVG